MQIMGFKYDFHFKDFNNNKSMFNSNLIQHPKTGSTTLFVLINIILNYGILLKYFIAENCLINSEKKYLRS